jgi:hypothetical protein
MQQRRARSSGPEPDAVSGITAAPNQDEGAELVATGHAPGTTAVSVWHSRINTFPGGAYNWSGWAPIGDRSGWVLPHTGPAVARNADRHLEAAAIGSDLAPWHAWQREPGGDSDDSGHWAEWISFGRPGGEEVISRPHGTMHPHPTPVLAGNADGCLEIFVVRHDLTVWHRKQTQPSHGPWSDWAPLGRPGDGTPGPLAAAANRDGRLELFANDLHGAVWHCWQNHPSKDWSQWHSLGTPGGQPARSGPAPVRNNDGRLVVFAVAHDGTVRHCWQPGGYIGERWSNWVSLGSQGSGLAELAVAANADGLLVLFATEPENGSDLWQREQAQQGGWSPWLSRASLLQPYSTDYGPIAGPTLVLMADHQLLLLLRASHFDAYHADDPDWGGFYSMISKSSSMGDWMGGPPWR